MYRPLCQLVAKSRATCYFVVCSISNKETIMKNQDLLPAIDICQARLDYNNHLIETMMDLDDREEVKDFYMKIFVSPTASSVVRNAFESKLLDSGLFGIQEQFCNQIDNDIERYNKILGYINTGNIKLLEAAHSINGMINRKFDLLKKFNGITYVEDKFEIFSLIDVSKIILSCLTESERLFLSFITFKEESEYLFRFDMDKFMLWINSHVNECGINISDIDNPDEQKKIQSDIEQIGLLVCDELQRVHYKISYKEKTRHNKLARNSSTRLVVYESPSKEHTQTEILLGYSQVFSKLIDAVIPNKVEALLVKYTNLIQDKGIDDTQQDLELPTNRKKKKNKSKRKKSANVSSKATLIGSTQVDSVDEKADLMELKPSIDAELEQVAEQHDTVRQERRSKSDKREEHKARVAKSNLNKLKKAAARKIADEYRHIDMVTSMQQMSSFSKDEKSSVDRDSGKFTISNDLILRNYESLLELFSPSVKTVTFHFARNLIISLGGVLESINGGSHHKVSFNKRLKGYAVSEVSSESHSEAGSKLEGYTVSGGISKPHGKSGNEMYGLNLRLLKTTLAKVLPENWRDTPQEKPSSYVTSRNVNTY